MTELGLYKALDNGQVLRLRRASRTRHTHIEPTHIVPDLPHTAQSRISLCNRECDGTAWHWTDGDVTCKGCLTVLAKKLVSGRIFFATTAQVAAMRNSARAEYHDEELPSERDYYDLSPEWTIG